MIFNISSLAKFINPRSFKKFVKNFMLLSGSLFIVGINISFELESIFTDQNLRTLVLIKIIVAYGLLYFFFYKILKYFLRYFFHSKLRDKIRKERDEFLNQISIEDKKSVSLLTDDLSKMIFKYLVKMGLITSNDLTVPLKINQTEKEDLFNEIVEDQYSWILLILHSLITTIIVFKFYAWWFILLMVLAIIVMMVSVFIMIYVLLHLEILEIIRKKLVRHSSQLM